MLQRRLPELHQEAIKHGRLLCLRRHHPHLNRCMVGLMAFLHCQVLVAALLHLTSGLSSRS